MKHYPRNAWYVACWVHDLNPDRPTALTILNELLVLWRSDGQLIALEDRCAHRAAPLSLGRCEGASLRCMYHGYLFDSLGKAISIPGQTIIPPNARVRAFPVVERHSWVWIWMGDPARADEALIPPAVGLDDPDWILGSGQMDYDAEACLINANLLDFSHLSFVHPASFGSGAEFADDLPTWEVIEREMRHIRWIPDMTSPPGDRQLPDKVDFYLEYDFLVPGILLMWTGHFVAGTAAGCRFGIPDYAAAIHGVARSCQAVTPIEPGKARYFFSVGPHREYGDEERRDRDLAIALMAFGEDKVMIEAQQRVLNRKPDHIVIPTAHDRAITMFNRLMDKIASEDSAIASVTA
jgi:phenylpropionate dioxygenase-like ring-hydroxylating dioxygenase large terminal subunit